MPSVPVGRTLTEEEVGEHFLRIISGNKKCEVTKE
jgi:hypothetical protein